MGRTWRLAGFENAGETKGGLLALQLKPDAMPPPCAAHAQSVLGLPLFA